MGEEKRVGFVPEAEKALVAAAFNDVDVLDLVDEEEFFDERWRAIWREARKMRREGIIPDTYAAVVRARLPLEVVAELEEYPISAFAAPVYAQQVRTAYRWRRLQRAVWEAQRLAKDGRELGEVLEELMAELRSIQEHGNEEAPTHVYQAAASALEKARALKERRGILSYWLGPHELLNWAEGELHVIMAATGVGKSAIGLQIAAHAAKEGWPTVIYSLEMSPEQVAGRYLSQLGVVTPTQLRRGEIPPDAWRRLEGVQGQIRDIPLYVESRYRHASTIMDNILRLRRSLGIRLVVIDYLGLLGLNIAKGEKRYEVLESMANRFKALAAEKDLTILILHQLNRHGESVASLESTGDAYGVLRPADGVYILSRKRDGEKRFGLEATWKIEKARHGELATIDLYFDPMRLAFDYEPSDVGYGTNRFGQNSP
jgi:replicative DNA helicase